jgi:hypothetical protein
MGLPVLSTREKEEILGANAIALEAARSPAGRSFLAMAVPLGGYRNSNSSATSNFVHPGRPEGGL